MLFFFFFFSLVGQIESFDGGHRGRQIQQMPGARQIEEAAAENEDDRTQKHYWIYFVAAVLSPAMSANLLAY